MSAAEWFPALPEADQAWLREHVGEDIPGDLIQRIIDRGGAVYTAYWVSNPPPEQKWSIGYADWKWIEDHGAEDDFFIVPTGR